MRAKVAGAIIVILIIALVILSSIMSAGLLVSCSWPGTVYP